MVELCSLFLFNKKIFNIKLNQKRKQILPKFSFGNSDRRIDFCSSIGREGTGLQKKKKKPSFLSIKIVQLKLLLSLPWCKNIIWRFINR